MKFNTLKIHYRIRNRGGSWTYWNEMPECGHDYPVALVKYIQGEAQNDYLSELLNVFYTWEGVGKHDVL